VDRAHPGNPEIEAHEKNIAIADNKLTADDIDQIENVVSKKVVQGAR